MSIWKWSNWLSTPSASNPVTRSNQVTLGEGNTPLVRSRQIGPALGISSLYFKLESANPSGSYKDRFAAAAISNMRQNGQTVCIATSSGNTGAALAAYCAAAQIRCRIAIVETAPAGKLKQMMAYGADIFRVHGFGLDPEITEHTFARLQQLSNQPNTALQISAFTYSAPGMNGVQTISFELADQMESAHHVFCPSGGGGLCVAVARGFARLVDEKQIDRSPAVHCVQPTGNDTIAGPLRNGKMRAREVQCTTEVSGLQVASVIDGDLVIEACRPTDGTGHTVDDATVWNLQQRLAREEGIFTEPAGAVALAGALQAFQRGEIDSDQTIVCLVTGSGFKDDASVNRMNANVDCPVIDVTEIE